MKKFAVQVMRVSTEEFWTDVLAENVTQAYELGYAESEKPENDHCWAQTDCDQYVEHATELGEE